MLVQHDDGYNPNVDTAREKYPGFEEKTIPFINIEKSLYECPRCKGRNFELFGTMGRCYTENWERGRLIRFEAESDEVRHIEVIVCLTCKIIWFVKYEEQQPGSPHTSFRSKEAVPHSSLSPKSAPKPAGSKAK